MEKSSYVLLEPLTVKFKYRILSSDFIPRVSQDTSVKITFKGVTKKLSRLTQNTVMGRPERLPARDNSVKFEYYEKDEVVDRSKEFFPEPGVYQLQFNLYGAESDPISITIEEPNGIDKEAFDFLNQLNGDISFQWVWEEKNGLAILEEFVSKYSQSIYGEYAVRNLGSIYFIKGELDKAKSEYEKIKSSKNRYIAELAKQALADITRNEASLKNTKQPQ